MSLRKLSGQVQERLASLGHAATISPFSGSELRSDVDIYRVSVKLKFESVDDVRNSSLSVDDPRYRASACGALSALDEIGLGPRLYKYLPELAVGTGAEKGFLLVCRFDVRRVIDLATSRD